MSTWCKFALQLTLLYLYKKCSYLTEIGSYPALFEALLFLYLKVILFQFITVSYSKAPSVTLLAWPTYAMNRINTSHLDCLSAFWITYQIYKTARIKRVVAFIPWPDCA